MNAKRIASLHRQLASLHAELADAYEQREPETKPRRTAVVAPGAEVSPQAEAAARRALRKQGVAA